MQAAPNPLFGKSFLVVEDEVLIALNIETWLEDAGAGRVETVHRLSSAQRALSEGGPFDAVVLDFRLADEDATPLIEVVRDRQIPVLLTTGDGALLREFPASPAMIILEKPFSENLFIASLVKLLSRS